MKPLDGLTEFAMTPTKQFDESARLPNIAYIGEVPVQASLHGSAQLYRLFENYPKSRLTIVECFNESNRSLRLRDAVYNKRFMRLGRFLRTRFHARIAYLLGILFRWGLIQLRWPQGLALPQAVVTVAHGVGWIVAAEFARRKNLPIHIIVHDVTGITPGICKILDDDVRACFDSAYRRAKTRLCISPGMADFFDERLQTQSVILYPSRTRDAEAVVCSHRIPGFRGPRVAYAGSVSHPAYLQAVVSMSALLSSLGGLLVLFGPHERSSLEAAGANIKHIELVGLVPKEHLVPLLARSADLTFLPASFAAEHQLEMKTLFPSKLADYLASGLPCLVWAPPSSSVAIWAKNEPGVVELVCSPDPGALQDALCELWRDKDRSVRIGQLGRSVGERYFGPDVVERTFVEAISKE